MSIGEDTMASQAVDDALNQIEAKGSRYYEAELWRLRGELLLRSGRDQSEGEACIRHAIDVARRQSARTTHAPSASNTTAPVAIA